MEQALTKIKGKMPDKMEKIFEAAVVEFAEKGYIKASTTRISQNAGVSKGLIFHYFGTKKSLYLAVFEKILSAYTSKINALTFDDCETYLENITKISDSKLEFFSKFPKQSEIIFEAGYRAPVELKEEIKEIIDKYVDMERYYTQWILAEQQKFRTGVDPRKAWEIFRAITDIIERRLIKEISASADGDGLLKVCATKERVEEFLEYYDMIFYGIAAEGGGRCTKKKGGRT